jgi:hypothetical protein
VLFDSMALYSSIAWHQWGSPSALQIEVETGDSVKGAAATAESYEQSMGLVTLAAQQMTCSSQGTVLKDLMSSATSETEMLMRLRRLTASTSPRVFGSMTQPSTLWDLRGVLLLLLSLPLWDHYPFLKYLSMVS